MRRARGWGALAACVLLATCVLHAAAGAAAPSPPTPAAAARGPVATRALLAGLRRTGRAEAVLRVRRPDPLGGAAVAGGGTLALELPRFARLDFAGGERLTLRPDGGDWLQPATRQLVRGGPQAAGGFLSWWTALLDPAGAGLVERRLGPRRYALERPGSDDPDQVVELGADGLPRVIAVGTGEGARTEFRVTRWRFVPPRGRAAFVLEPPPGYEVVDVP